MGDAALDGPVLSSVFEKWWPELESKIIEVLKEEEQQTIKNIRSERDLLEEILSLTRFIYYGRPANVYHPIDILKLSDSVHNLLSDKNIIFIIDLVQLTENDLMKSYKLSRKSIFEIKEALLEHGLHLGMKLP